MSGNPFCITTTQTRETFNKCVTEKDRDCGFHFKKDTRIVSMHTKVKVKVKLKVKESRNSSGVTQRFSGVLGSQISITVGT